MLVAFGSKPLSRQPSTWVAALAAAAVALGPSAAAHADDKKQGEPLVDGTRFHDGMGIEVGAIIAGGFGDYAINGAGLAPSLQGLVLRDRNGVTSRMIIGLVIAIGGALAESGPKSVERRSYRSGNYVVTETKTTYYSEAEKAQMRENTNRAIGGLFTAPYSDFELHLYSRDRFGRGDASGFKANFFVGSGDKSFSFETGIGLGFVDSVMAMPDMPGTDVRIDYRYLGMPFRFSSVIKDRVRLALTFEWNWLTHTVDEEDRGAVMMGGDGAFTARTASFPWHLDLSTVVLKRIALTGGVTTQSIWSPKKVGYFATAGVFF